ncbi:basic proline-rich protein-like [Pongo pygmaeus]|uniref:basic proline-rich protein-like n=1 Tax=Pongo pygmaeus TaxID=9600 RepID=UPI00300C0687
MRGGATAPSPLRGRPPLPGRPAAPTPPPVPARRLHKRRHRGVRSPRPPEPPRPRAALTSAAAAPRLILRTRAPGSGRSPAPGGALPRWLCAAARRGRGLARPGVPAADLAAWPPLPPPTPPRPPQRLSPAAGGSAPSPPPPACRARARRGGGAGAATPDVRALGCPCPSWAAGAVASPSRPPAADGRGADGAAARPELRDRGWAAPEPGAGARDRPGVAAPPARARLRRPCPPSCLPLGARLLRFGDGVSLSPRLERGEPPSSRDPAASASLVAGTAGARRPAIGVCVGGVSRCCPGSRAHALLPAAGTAPPGPRRAAPASPSPGVVWDARVPPAPSPRPSSSL